MDLEGLIIDLEEEFDFTFQDEDFDEIMTVGDLQQYLLVRKEQWGQVRSREIAQQTFQLYFKLRDSIRATGGRGPSRIRPSQPLNAAVATGRQRRFWADLQHRWQSRLPRLRPPGPMLLAFILFVPAFGLLVLYDLYGPQAVDLDVVGYFCFGYFWFMVAGWALILTVGRSEFPSELPTIRSLIRWKLAHEGQLSYSKLARVDEFTIRERVIDLVSLHSGVPRDIVHPESMFGEDLMKD